MTPSSSSSSFDASARQTSAAATGKPVTPEARCAATNAVTGHHAQEIAPSAQAAAGAIRFVFTLPGQSMGAPLHYHEHLQEVFIVRQGELSMEVGGAGRWRILRAGEQVVVAPGLLHSFRNASDRELVFETEVTPGARFGGFIRVMYGLAQDGLTDKQGAPRDWAHLVLALELADLRLPGLPKWLQDMLFGPQGRIARGLRAHQKLQRYLPPGVAL